MSGVFKRAPSGFEPAAPVPPGLPGEHAKAQGLDRVGDGARALGLDSLDVRVRSSRYLGYRSHPSRRPTRPQPPQRGTPASEGWRCPRGRAHTPSICTGHLALRCLYAQPFVCSVANPTAHGWRQGFALCSSTQAARCRGRAGYPEHPSDQARGASYFVEGARAGAFPQPLGRTCERPPTSTLGYPYLPSIGPSLPSRTAVCCSSQHGHCA